jgi:hypothetical protein
MPEGKIWNGNASLSTFSFSMFLTKPRQNRSVWNGALQNRLPAGVSCLLPLTLENLNRKLKDRIFDKI